ncbi:hypothetical protein EYF80_021574 [Liparis tanakae]|uniref:Uncharacterized protein n=1 Tax=Liparis tanakae TaxID=230148 RepID=A0A4Z2HTQ1_9TELE|nr:hypothetical protein EYF80_021574 [Liparis tanakae]
MDLISIGPGVVFEEENYRTIYGADDAAGRSHYQLSRDKLGGQVDDTDPWPTAGIWYHHQSGLNPIEHLDKTRHRVPGQEEREEKTGKDTLAEPSLSPPHYVEWIETVLVCLLSKL